MPARVAHNGHCLRKGKQTRRGEASKARHAKTRHGNQEKKQLKLRQTWEPERKMKGSIGLPDVVF